MTRLTATMCALLFFTGAGYADTAKPKTRVARIGTYDSRAIAVAFVGSEVYKATVGKKMSEMMAEYKKAESEGDKKRVKELKTWGETQQALLHKQVFSTAPVDDILKHIIDQFPEIKKKAGVELLVSKWDTQTLAKHTSAEQIDITMLLIDAFKPNEKQKRSAIEIQKHEPVPLENMKNHKH